MDIKTAQKRAQKIDSRNSKRRLDRKNEKTEKKQKREQRQAYLKTIREGGTPEEAHKEVEKVVTQKMNLLQKIKYKLKRNKD
jgi:hypothetical protein